MEYTTYCYRFLKANSIVAHDDTVSSRPQYGTCVVDVPCVLRVLNRLCVCAHRMVIVEKQLRVKDLARARLKISPSWEELRNLDQSGAWPSSHPLSGDHCTASWRNNRRRRPPIKRRATHYSLVGEEGLDRWLDGRSIRHAFCQAMPSIWQIPSRGVMVSMYIIYHDALHQSSSHIFLTPLKIIPAVGPNDEDAKLMLQSIGFNSLDELIKSTIPSNIMSPRPLNLQPPMTESEALSAIKGELHSTPSAYIQTLSKFHNYIKSWPTRIT